MPLKRQFERDLVRVNIRRKDHDGIVCIRHGSREPFYSLVQRIWLAYNTHNGILENENEILKESVQKWKQRALAAESKLEYQTQIV
jgi:hypothetical protein